ncbi:response regulator [Nonomuraea wenchangensis]|uniref:response regulator n=1 Tax=Nonomuraea wenchangensis TaxID=568860 RepID=UPI0037246F3F
MIRLLIVDDHRVYREGIRLVLTSSDQIEIIGEAASGSEAIDAVRRLRVDVVLMDLKMPGVDGIEAARTILAEQPGLRILALTMFEDNDMVFAAMRAGMRGYLLKDADRDELVRAITAVHRGEAIFSPPIAQLLIDWFATMHPATSSRVSELAFPQLTGREREILDLIAQGFRNQDIALQLFVSIKTVRNHVSNIFTKLAVSDRSQAIVRARDAGLGRHSPD